MVGLVLVALSCRGSRRYKYIYMSRGRPVRFILVRNWWTSIEYDSASFRAFAPLCYGLFPHKRMLFGDVASKQCLKAVSTKGLSLGILPLPSFLPSDLGDCD